MQTITRTFDNEVKATPVAQRNKATGDTRQIVAIPLPPRKCWGYMERLAVAAERAEYTTTPDAIVTEQENGRRIACRKVG